MNFIFDPNRPVPKRKGKTYGDLFWEKVDKQGDNGCWNWTGCTLARGYGYATIAPNVRIGAHRASYLLHFGIYDETKDVCHVCDNPSCVNPNHLFLADHSENMADMMKKGRHDNGCSKVTPEQVLEIRHRYENDEISCAKLSEDYPIAPTTIWFIVTNQTHKSLL